MKAMTAEVIKRVFPVEHGGRTGTAFTIREEGKEFLVTASHVVKGYEETEGLGIGCGTRIWGKLKKMTPKLLHDDKNQDIAVFEAPECTHSDLPLKSMWAEICLGQEVMWMGYPKGFDGGLLGEETGTPIGIVGKGVVGALKAPRVIQREGGGGFLIEGVVNKGYSGSPVVYRPLGSLDGPTYVAGVISKSLAGDTNLSLIMAGNLSEVMNKVHERMAMVHV